MSGDETRLALLDAAYAAAAKGWYVFPIRPGHKTPPAVKGWDRRATIDPERIERCWSTDTYNAGIACGPSGLLVVDLDLAKPGDPVPAEYQQTGIRTGVEVLADLEGVHGDLPPTYTVRTPSGGSHLYFTVGDGVRLGISKGRLGWLIDTRGAGGYVVAAGSTLAGGRSYEVINDTAPAPLPGWIADRLRDQPTSGPATPGAGLPSEPARRAGFIAAAVRGELGRVLSPRNVAARNIGPREHGPGRNHDLYDAARRLGRLVLSGDLDRGVVIAALTVAARAVGLDEKEASQTIRSGLLAAANPNTADGRVRPDDERREAA